MGRSLPDRFPPAEESYSLYEDIEYQEYWQEPGLDRLDALEQHIISRWLPASGRRIIDLGCGYGRLAPCYIDRFDEVILCDGSTSLLRDARTALGDRVTLVASDVTRLPFKSASFDCVLTIRVLQHMHDLPAVFEELRRISDEDGSLIFSYHNKTNPNRILRYLRSRDSGNPFSLEPINAWGTLISRHPKEVGALLHRARFSEPEYQGTVVVNALAKVTDRFAGRAPAGARWAPLLGRYRLAPWLIGRSFAQGNGDIQPRTRIDDLFECPLCHGDLDRTDQGFECPACQRDYPIHEGILDFRT